MANDFIKAEKVVAGVIGALKREVVLPSLIWLDPAGDFKGAKNDTISLSIPAVASARSRVMRSGSTRSRDALNEGKVDVTLTTNLYKDVTISDEELTLDIADFSAQVLQPIVFGMAQGWEEEIADLMSGASYEHTLTWDSSDPHKTFVQANSDLNRSNVPQSGRSAVIGSALAEEFVLADKIRDAGFAGEGLSAGALRDATVAGRFAGFDRIVVSNAIGPNEGYAFHRTAYVASSKVPVVPAGVTWGASFNSNGFSMRAIRDFDSSATGWVDILGFDSFVGSNVVRDHGAFDLNGKWIPAEDPDFTGNTDRKFIRAVKITGGSSS